MPHTLVGTTEAIFFKAVIPNIFNTEIPFDDFLSLWARCLEKLNTSNCIYQYLIYFPTF